MRQRKRTENSAEQPATKCDVSEKIRTLQECKTWLQALPSHKILESKPLQRIHEAIAVLQADPSREQRQTIQQLLRDWDVPQKTQGCKRKFDEVKSDLASKVADEACRLKRLRHAFEERRTDPSAANANASFSAIQASLQQRKLER